eukprot:1145901-Pelagomonas_calceolata.AAC.1
MSSCPESTSRKSHGLWDNISREVEFVLGAVRGVAQRVAARWTGDSGAAAWNMAIPLGRNNPPPEQILCQGAEPQWMPEPHGPVLDPGNYRMLAGSGTLYRLHANKLREVVTEWCQEKNKIPDTQFGFYPGRNTLQPMPIVLRHLQHATQVKHPNASPRLHAAFINLKQIKDGLVDNVQKAVTGSSKMQITGMLHADDLTLPH